MKFTYKKIIGAGVGVLALMIIILGWQPIKAATGRFVFGFNQIKINDGLIGYWPFEMGSTTYNIAQDFSLSGNDGAISGTATATAQATGAVGQGLKFDGVNDYVKLAQPPSSSTNLTTGSVFAWIKTTGAGSSYRGIIVKQNAYGMYLKDNVLILYDFGGAADRTTSVSLNDGRWHFVGFTFQSGVSSGTKIYIDGQVSATVTITVSSQGVGIAIGAGNNPATLDQYFKGQIDEGRLYNRVLSPGEVSYLYSHAGPGSSGSVKQPTKTGLIGYWNFDDCDSCSTATDKSVSANNATLYSTCASVVGNIHASSGKLGLGLTGDGTDNCAVITDTFDPTSYTISAWVKPSLVAASSIFVRSSGTDPTSFWSHQLRVNSSGNFEAYLNDGSPLTVSGSTPIVANTWYHVVATAANSGQMHLYVNGVEEGTAVSVGTMSTNGDTYLIASNSGDGMGYFNGVIDEVRLYSRALSADEIRALYNETARRIINVSSNKINNNGAVIDLSFDGTNVDWGNSSAEIKDTSGSGKDGDAAGMNKIDNIRTGVNGQAIYFDGVDDSVATSYVGPTVAPVSFVFWVKPDTATPVGIFDSAPGSPNVLRNYSSGVWEWWSGDPSISFSLTPGVWQHVVLVYWYDTARHIDYYLDGVLKATATGSSSNSLVISSLRLGDINAGGAGRYAGALDNFRVYLKQFSAGDVANIYAQDKHGGR